MGLKNYLDKRKKAFLDSGKFEIFYSNGEFRNIGLKWGYGKKLKGLGFKRGDQIFLLNELSRDIKDFKLCGECLGNNLKAIDNDEGFFIVCECGNILNKNHNKGV